MSQPTMIHSVFESDQEKDEDSRTMDRENSLFLPSTNRSIFLLHDLLRGIFGFVLLVDYFPLNQSSSGRRSGYLGLQIPITETILHICIWSLICEEIRQFVSSKSKREYISEVWNKLDVLAIGLYLVGFITRFIVPESLFVVSKIFMCLDLIIWYVRTLNLFAAYEKLGLKLIMIFNTIKDLLFFVCFILIFLLEFSVAFWSLITTVDQVTWNYGDDGTSNATIQGGGSSLWSWQLLRDVTNYGIWKIFGQVDPITGTDAYSAVAFVLAILFLAIANVLLLNVLVALFNLTIQDVQNRSYRICRYQRFVIVFEYRQKPLLPPPFNSLYYVFIGLKYLYQKISPLSRCRSHVGTEPIVMDSIDVEEPTVPEEFKVTDAMQRESAIADDYWWENLKQGKKNQAEVALGNIERQLHDLKERIQNNNTNNQVMNFNE